jgi:hypothetical protein
VIALSLFELRCCLQYSAAFVAAPVITWCR